MEGSIRKYGNKRYYLFDIKDVQTRLSHSEISTTLDTYTHATEKMSNQAVDIFKRMAKLPTV